MKKIFLIPMLVFILASCSTEDFNLPVEESDATDQTDASASVEQLDSYDLLVKGSPYRIVRFIWNGRDISDINMNISRFSIDTNLNTYDIKIYQGSTPLPSNIDNAIIQNIGITDDYSGTIFSDDTPQELDYTLSNFGSNVEITFTTGVGTEFEFTYKMYCNSFLN